MEKSTSVTSPPQQIDPETAESFIGEKKIGERIKRLRLKKSMGLVELGKHTGLSASFLSQLETGRVVPTLRNLARIAMVFSKDLSYFFDPEPRTLFRVHRQSERVRLPQSGVEDPTYFFESLGYLVPDRTLDPYLAEFIPLNKGVEVRSHVHPGFRISVRAEWRDGYSAWIAELYSGAGRFSLFRREHAAQLSLFRHRKRASHYCDAAPGSPGAALDELATVGDGA